MVIQFLFFSTWTPQELLQKEQQVLEHGRHCVSAAGMFDARSRGRYYVAPSRCWVQLQHCMLSSAKAYIQLGRRQETLEHFSKGFVRIWVDILERHHLYQYFKKPLHEYLDASRSACFDAFYHYLSLCNREQCPKKQTSPGPELDVSLTCH